MQQNDAVSPMAAGGSAPRTHGWISTAAAPCSRWLRPRAATFVSLPFPLLWFCPFTALYCPFTAFSTALSLLFTVCSLPFPLPFHCPLLKMGACHMLPLCCAMLPPCIAPCCCVPLLRLCACTPELPSALSQTPNESALPVSRSLQLQSLWRTLLQL